MVVIRLLLFLEVVIVRSISVVQHQISGSEHPIASKDWQPLSSSSGAASIGLLQVMKSMVITLDI
uniref:Uncharacterized protein n=1 Tax=Helianthus annuus TaxID=4232 RepID=A0A251SYG1_HELAN